MKLSIISPVYKSPMTVSPLISEIMSSIPPAFDEFEIILVDDGCPMNSWEIILTEARKNHCVVGVKLSRNFGQHYAITAGLSFAKGDYIVVMDCDLQDKPSEIGTLYNKVILGYDIVWAVREIRNDSTLKKKISFLFYKWYNYLTGMNHDYKIANFGIFHRKVIDASKGLNEHVRGFPYMINWLGFQVGKVSVQHGLSERGFSAYNFRRLVSFGMDVMFAYSNRPLKLAIFLGCLMSLFALLFGVYNVILFFNGSIGVPGYASIIVSIWFCTGVLLFSFGITGIYVSKIYDEVKNRPLFVIDKLINI